jgi:hypothetical protein
MPKKITFTDDDGSVTELTDEIYTSIFNKAATAFINSQAFDDKLQSIAHKMGDKMAERLAAVEAKQKEQGEKIKHLENELSQQSEVAKNHETRVTLLENTVSALKKNLVSQRESQEKEKQETRRRIVALEQKSDYGCPGDSLSSCPDPGNLQEEFKSLLAAKQKNKHQIILGPIFSKEDGDGFHDKNDLDDLEEEEVVAALRDAGVVDNFVVIMSNPARRLAKVRFEGPFAEASCKKVLAAWRTLRDDHQMWAGPDQPVDLSRMTANAKKFGINLRSAQKLPNSSYVEVHDGVLFIGAIRVAPVYLIPGPDKWQLIEGIIGNEIRAFLSLPWTARKVKASSVDMVSLIWDAVWKNI